MQTASFPIVRVRSRFPALTREVAGATAVYFDGPAGSQVPSSVVEAVSGYLTGSNANLDGAFATSVESDQMLVRAREAVADLFGAVDSDAIVFGANMTSLTYELGRSLARGWRPGDEVVVTDLDHDANVTTWVQAAERAGARVHRIRVRHEDCTLDLDDLRARLNDRTRLVAVGAASNLVGTVNPVAEIAELAHAVGALVFVDAVHYAPHRAMDVRAWGCDFCACSAYKFFGPHVGALWGRADLLGELPVDKLRPVDDKIPDRFMHGTQNHEGIAGTLAAVDYLAELGREFEGRADAPRRAALLAAYAAIEGYETRLCRRLLDGLAELDGFRVWGFADSDRTSERVPTVAFTHRDRSPRAIAEHLAARGIFVWSGNNYALPLTEALGLEPDGVVRVGLLHYNTSGEVDRLLAELRRL